MNEYVALDGHIRVLSHEEKEQVVEILLGARDLIAEEGHWCQSHDAMDAPIFRIGRIGLVAEGEPPLTMLKIPPTGKMPKAVDPRMSEAVSFCWRGAIMRSTTDLLGLTAGNRLYGFAGFGDYTLEKRYNRLYAGAMAASSHFTNNMGVTGYNDSIARVTEDVTERIERAASAVKDLL